MSFQACKSFVRLRSTIEDILDEKQEACDAPIDCQTINRKDTVKILHQVHLTVYVFIIMY